MTESPLAIANFFVRKAGETQSDLTPMKLLKLVYIAHGWHLGITSRPLISEDVEAWRYGPVIRSMYKEFKNLGDGQIRESDVSNNCPIRELQRLEPFLNSIWDKYGCLSGTQLSTLTHEQETPWDITWNKMGGKSSGRSVIPNELIRDHYRTKVDANRRNAAAQPT